MGRVEGWRRERRLTNYWAAPLAPPGSPTPPPSSTEAVFQTEVCLWKKRFPSCSCWVGERWKEGGRNINGLFSFLLLRATVCSISHDNTLPCLGCNLGIRMVLNFLLSGLCLLFHGPFDVLIARSKMEGREGGGRRADLCTGVSFLNSPLSSPPSKLDSREERERESVNLMHNLEELGRYSNPRRFQKNPESTVEYTNTHTQY